MDSVKGYTAIFAWWRLLACLLVHSFPPVAVSLFAHSS